MSRNTAQTKVPPSEVWNVISQPFLYAEWVVGTREVLEADDLWPAEGAVLHHSSGIGPVEVKDVTKVLENAEPNHIKLEARLGSIGTAHVTLNLVGNHDETELVMIEEFVEGAPSKVDVVTDAALKGRNEETLRRLVNLAEERAGRKTQ